MIARRLLTTESKLSIKEAFKENAVFRTIYAAYKEQETKMETLRFSPQEIWVNCFIGFDQILKHYDDIDDITRHMWDDIFCELRDEVHEAPRAYNNNELETATSCIIYSIIACVIASKDWKIIQHSETLMFQISEHSELSDIARPFDENIEGGFCEYIQKYISLGKYVSDSLESPKTYVDPINYIATPQERTKAKLGVKKRLEFMMGYLPDSEIQIMTSSNFNTMIEAVEYLIENDVVKKQETKLHTNMPIAHLRYTFYLVFKNEGKCINRQLWIDFLGETFSQMQNNKNSIYNHFSDVPDGYSAYIQPIKKSKRGG